MNITNKITLVVMFCFIIALFTMLPFVLYHINESGQQEVERYKQEEINRVKQSLKEYVDIAYMTLDTNYKNSMDKQYLAKNYGQQLIHVVDIAESILKTKAEAVKLEGLELSEALEQAAAEVAKLRYDNGNGYVWISDTTEPHAKMIMHPLEPELNGKILDDTKYNTALGKEQNIYQAAVEICHHHGKGFIDYLWSKNTPNGVVEDMPMLAYVRLFEDWNWIIGTSTYVDSAITDTIENSKDEIRKMRYTNGIGNFWIIDTKVNLKMLVNSDDFALEDQNLSGKVKQHYNSILKSCRQQNGSCFHTNNAAKLPHSKEKVAKLSYIKLYEPLGWMLGTGFYLDDINKTVAEKEATIREEIKDMTITLVVIAIMAVILISVLGYIMLKYFPRIKKSILKYPKEHEEHASQQISTTKEVYRPKDGEIISPIHSDGNMIRTDECIKMVQEVSKTLISEHSKWLADNLANSGSTINDIKRQANKRSHTNIVMNDLDKMVGK
ncbi:cache domain-containing protein [Thiotrichales bacterium HSG1]|nr:cache domain-containing protein [Thiotrichales bacterium HSG1]